MRKKHSRQSRESETVLGASPPQVARMASEQIQKLVHELQAHQIELKSQNEELLRTETDLAQSRDRFNDLYDFAPVGYLTLDKDAVVLAANLTVAVMLGVERKNLVGHKFTRFVAREAQDALYLHQRSALGGDQKQTCKLFLRRADQTEFTALMETVRAPGPTERVFHCRSVLTDITEREQAEAALARLNAILEQQIAERTQELRESEARLRAEAAALATLNDASSRLWRMGTLREGLEAVLAPAIELVGADMGNVQILDSQRGVLLIAAQCGFGQDFLDFFGEVSADDDSACGRALRTRGRIMIEDVETDLPFAPFRAIARAAGYRAVQSTPLLGRDGAPLGMLSTHWRSPHRPSEQELRRLDLCARQAADFIERCRSDEQLRASEERFRVMADQAPVLIWMGGPDKRCIWFNRQWLEFTGRTLEQELGDGWTQSVHPEDLARCLDTYVSAFDARESFVTEYRLRRHDGEWRWALDHGIPLRGGDGEFTGYIGSCIDITACKHYQENLAQLAQQLAEKNKELETVLHVISHNLRSPLVNIQGFSNELVRLCEEMQMKISTAQGGTLPARELAHAFEEEIPRALQFIRTGVTRLDALLSGFLRFSRLGQAALQIRTVDMDQVLAGTVQAARFQIEQAGAQVEVGPLPGCLGDAIHVGQVFANLLDNALKYRDPHRPLRVAVSGRIEGDRAIYAVADNGIGIAPEHQAKVFEMFRRLNPRAAPGEGLGLAIAQRIVERQQGRIWVESKPGQGATFFVSLPANPSRVSNS